MKILHFSDSLRAGGQERQLVDLIKGLSAYDDIKVELALMSKEQHYNEINAIKIPIHYLIGLIKKMFVSSSVCLHCAGRLGQTSYMYGIL